METYKLQEEIKINVMKIRFMLDIAADDNIFTYQISEKIKHKTVFGEANKKFYSDTGHKFAIHGECQLLGQLNINEKCLSFLISKSCDISIMVI